jgi:large subunit ribosomal protein L25
MSTIVIAAAKRTPGRSAARTLRTQGHVPGVYYAKGKDPIHFSVPALSLRSVVYTAEAKMVRLEVEGSPAVDCILKDVTFDPVTDRITHIDFQGVALGEKVAVEIPVHLVGTAEGIKFGGVIEHVTHKIHAKADPHNMPEHIDVDVTNLNIGQSIHISDLNIPALVITDKPDLVVVACSAPRVASSDTPSAE